jgi:hypothetical protein
MPADHCAVLDACWTAELQVVVSVCNMGPSNVKAGEGAHESVVTGGYRECFGMGPMPCDVQIGAHVRPVC